MICLQNNILNSDLFVFLSDMMMDTAVQQPTDANGQPIVTPAERQAVLQKLYFHFQICSQEFRLSFVCSFL